MYLSNIRRTLLLTTLLSSQFSTSIMSSTTSTLSTNSNFVPRSLASVLVAQKKLEGGGFPVRRPAFPGSHVHGLILLFDHMGPMTLQPGEDFPGPEHPHRGFITISYHLQGHLAHYCSSGVTGIMGPGCAQWMIAGRGVVHGGSTPDFFKKTGGQIEAFQIWINLKKKDKMIFPKYQDIMPHQLPIVKLYSNTIDNTASTSSLSTDTNAVQGTVKLISGTFQNTTGPVETVNPVSMFDVRLQPNGNVDIPIPHGQTGVIYVYRGEAIVGSERKVLSEGMAGILTMEGTTLSIQTSKDAPLIDIPAPHTDITKETESAACGIIIVFGEPINEPIYRYGPFVMNTEEEIHQALQDYRSGKIERESRMKPEDIKDDEL